MLTIRIAVNGQPVEHINVINRGPVDGVYVEGDEPGGDGERVYEWYADSPTQAHGQDRGMVVHRRGNGAVLLAEKVLGALAATRMLDSPDPV